MDGECCVAALVLRGLAAAGVGVGFVGSRLTWAGASRSGVAAFGHDGC